MEEEMVLEVKDSHHSNAIELHMMLDDVLPDVEIYPFTRHVWHGPKMKEYWNPIFEKARAVHDKAEYEMVKRGHRRAATLHLTNNTYDKQIERIQNDGLVWLPIQRTKIYSGFSHKHFPTSPNDPNSSVYGVLACDLKTAKKFKEASMQNPTDHDTIGELLGFPKCCRNFFNEVWVGGFYDPVWQSAERTPGVKYKNHNHAVVDGSILCVQSLRYGGFRVTSHLPCSFRCEPSIEIGKKWLETMLDIDLEAASGLVRILSSSHTWSVLHGVAVVEHPAFTIWTNSLATKQKWTIDYSPVDYVEMVNIVKSYEEGRSNG